MRLGELAAIRSEEYAAAVQRLRGCNGGTCRLIGKLEIFFRPLILLGDIDFDSFSKNKNIALIV